ncbi:MAG: S1C family serine protease [Thermoanaerobaculia bacterium]
MRRSFVFPILMFIALVAGGAFWAGAAWTGRQAVAPAAMVPFAAAPPSATVAPAQNASRGAIPPRPEPELRDEERATVDLFRRASPAVVFVTSIAVQRSSFSLNTEQIPRGTGSGFIWDRQGHVVTNFHVIAGGNAAQVTLADGSNWPARIIGGAAEKDLAVLKIEAPANRLTALPLGRSETLQVGQSVFAIGNPFGLDQTLTTGVVSALGREIQSLAGNAIRDVIQSDAAINPGNSGGPLLDSSGRLVGVNTAIYSPSGSSAGIGFAIPSHDVASAVPELIRYGQIRRPTLGVELAPEGLAQRLGLEGVVIMNVSPGSAAARAGLRGLTRNRFGQVELGDVIQTFNGTPVNSNGDLLIALEALQAGQTARVGVLRGDRRVEVPVRLGGDR